MEECYFQYSYRLKPATLLKLTFLHRRFSSFLNSTNGTKSRKPSQFTICHVKYFSFILSEGFAMTSLRRISNTFKYLR